MIILSMTAAVIIIAFAVLFFRILIPAGGSLIAALFRAVKAVLTVLIPMAFIMIPVLLIILII